MFSKPTTGKVNSYLTQFMSHKKPTHIIWVHFFLSAVLVVDNATIAHGNWQRWKLQSQLFFLSGTTFWTTVFLFRLVFVAFATAFCPQVCFHGTQSIRTNDKAEKLFASPQHKRLQKEIQSYKIHNYK